MNERDHGVLRVHVLGPLRVILVDGTSVPIQDWRTGKTRDLLRLLALAGGRPVRSAELAEKLWRDVDEGRRRNSLRTAASQIRKIVGSGRLTRRPDGLVLEDCWVDALQFREHAGEAQEAARGQQHGRVVELALRAGELYRADFQAYDDDAFWARTVREDLIQVRTTLLVDAAVSALALQLFRESLDFATAAVRLDPGSESAHRSLMRAHAELGEVPAALRVFESYRLQLAEELGTEPSAETRELHLRLLAERSS